MTDIPRELWAKTLALQGLRSSLATSANFWVAHLMIPNTMRADYEQILTQISERIVDAGLDILIERPGEVESYVLGRSAEKNEPLFWQIAGTNGRVAVDRLESTIYRLQMSIERDFGVHFPSFSSRSVVYKVQGTVEILRRYYPESATPNMPRQSRSATHATVPTPTRSLSAPSRSTCWGTTANSTPSCASARKRPCSASTWHPATRTRRTWTP